MWLFRQFIVRQLLAEPLRTGGTVLGVALGIAVVVAIRLANASSIAGFETALDTMAGRTSVEIIGSAVGIDETRLSELEWLRDYGEVSPVVEGEALAEGRDSVAHGGAPVGEGGAPVGEGGAPVAQGSAPVAQGFSPAIGDKVPEGFSPAASRPPEMLRILGVDILRDRALRDYALTSDAGLKPCATGEAAATGEKAAGLKPCATGEATDARQFLDLLLDPRAIVLTEKFAKRRDLRTGSEITLTIGDVEKLFVVRGLLKDEGPARVVDGNFALMDIAAAQWAFDRLGRLDRIDIRLHDPEAIDRAEAEIASRLPDGLTAQRPARRGRQVEQMLSAFHLNLTALSYIALIVGLFLVYNTVSISVIARRHEVGTLRALGVTRRGVLALFLGEALVLSLAGTALGLLLGQALGHGAVGLTATTVKTLYIATAAAPPSVSWLDALVALGIGVPLSLAAAWAPAREAAAVTPISAIRGADRLETRYQLRPRFLLVPGALLLLGAWLATRGPIAGLPLAGYASAVAFVFGAATLVPAVLFAAARLGGRLMAAAFGVEGFLANANLAGAIPRLSISVAALAVSLSMMVAIAVMIGSFRETVIHWVGQTFKADLFISPSTRESGARQATISDDVDRLVTEHPAVEAVDRFRNTSIPYNDSQVFLGAGDFEVLLARGGLLFKAPSGARAAMLEAIGQDAVVVTEAFAIRHRAGVGDTVRLPTPTGLVPFRIAAIYYDYSSDRGSMVMDRRTFARHFGNQLPTGLTVYLREGADPEAVREALLTSIGSERRVHVYTNAGLRQEVLRIFDSTFAITYALEVIAVLVAIIGVAATLLTLILERRRELTMLRLIGAGRRQVRKMVMLEAAMLGGVSQAIGLGVGVLLSLVLIYVINLQSFGWTIQFHLPVAFLAQMSLVILVATALAGIYPARIASRLAVGEPLEDE